MPMRRRRSRWVTTACAGWPPGPATPATRSTATFGRVGMPLSSRSWRQPGASRDRPPEASGVVLVAPPASPDSDVVAVRGHDAHRAVRLEDGQLHLLDR